MADDNGNGAPQNQRIRSSLENRFNAAITRVTWESIFIGMLLLVILITFSVTFLFAYRKHDTVDMIAITILVLLMFIGGDIVFFNVQRKKEIKKFEKSVIATTNKEYDRRSRFWIEKDQLYDFSGVFWNMKFSLTVLIILTLFYASTKPPILKDFL